jgi:hypothetical protein
MTIGGAVGLHEILTQIDREINQLKQARAMLEGNPKNTPKKRNITPEGRRRIAEAVKRRWAEQKQLQPVESAGGWVIDNSPPKKLA